MLQYIIELFLTNPFWQTFSLTWMFLVWLAFLNEDDLKTIKLLFIANIFWGLSYFLLESYAGFIACIIWWIRMYLSMKYKRNFKAFIIIIIVTIITWILTFSSIYSLLPIIWTFIWTYSFFYFSWIKLRIWCIIISFLLLIYNIYIWSIWWIINEVVVEILIIFTIIHYLKINNFFTNIMLKVHTIIDPYKNFDYWHFIVVKFKDKKRIIETIKKWLKKHTPNFEKYIRFLFKKIK